MSGERARPLVVVALALGLSSLLSCRSSMRWGFGAVDRMETPPDPPLVCGAAIPEAHALERAACAYGAGAHAADTLNVPPELARTIPIRHVLVVMKENRSFDHLFGRLHDLGQPDSEPVPPTFANPGPDGTLVHPYPADTTCIPWDPPHQSRALLAAVNGGAMDGFVTNAASATGTDGSFVMSEYGDTDLPFYYWLANTYAIADHHFAPMPSGTYGNRSFFLFGTNAGVVDTGIAYPHSATNSIFRSLMNAGYTWRAYSDGAPLSGTLYWQQGDPGVRTLQDLYDDLDAGTLPNVAFVDAREVVDDDHPPYGAQHVGDLQVGEAWLAGIYGHVVASPQWERLALIWTYDEGGGFADHVPPPKGCLPGVSDAWPDPTFGPRVSLVAISPWAKRHYVSHVVHDHTALTRFVEAIFDLPALTARDANSDALFDLFDFSCGRDLAPPAGAPSPGTGGCP